MVRDEGVFVREVPANVASRRSSMPSRAIFKHTINPRTPFYLGLLWQEKGRQLDKLKARPSDKSRSGPVPQEEADQAGR